MFRTEVFGDGAAGPGAAAQGGGGHQAVVVECVGAAHTRLVNQQTGDRQFHAGVLDQFLVAGVDDGGVTCAFCQQVCLCHCHAVLEVFAFQMGEQGEHLFAGQRLIQTSLGELHADGNGVSGDLDAQQLRQGLHVNTNYVAVELAEAVGEADVADLIDHLGIVDVMDVLFLQQLQDVSGHALGLGGADHAVVKGLRMDDGGNRQQNVGAVVNDGGGVAGADAQSGLAGGVCSLDHAGAAGAQDGVSSGHHHLSQFHVGVVNALEDVCGAAHFLDSLFQDLAGVRSGDLCAGMGSEHQDVSTLQCIDAVDQNGHVGVGGGDDACDDALGMCDEGQVMLFVVADDASGLQALDGIPYASGGAAVLHDLVFYRTQTGLFHCFLRQLFADLYELLQAMLADCVDLFLGQLLQLCQSLSAVCYHQVDGCLIVHTSIVNNHTICLLCYGFRPRAKGVGIHSRTFVVSVSSPPAVRVLWG